LLKIIHGGGNPLIINQIQSSTQVLDESYFAQIESIPETPENEKYLAGLGLDLKSASAGNLPNGAKVLVLAYKKNGDTYTFHKEHIFEVGKDSDFRLNGGQNYTLIFVSTGTDYLPKTGNKNNLTDAYFSFDRINSFPNGQIVYQRIDNLIPNGNIPKNKLDIRLKKRTVGVRIVLDASNVLGGAGSGRKITSIKNAKLTYRTLPITNDLRFRCSNFSRYGDNYHNKEKIVNFTESSSNNQIKTSDLIEDLMYLGDNTQVIFTAEVEIEGLSRLNIQYELKNINIGHKKTYNLKLKSCGAYLGPNRTNWRQFMCHNLGADTSLDPFTPGANIHGDKYQWGHKNPVIKQENDKYTGSFPNWPKVVKTNTWNNGIDDPCPDGYRVPTVEEWENFTKYNYDFFTKIGNWSSTTAKNADAGIKFRDNLFLPTAGGVNSYGSTKYKHNPSHTGPYSIYWSSTYKFVFTADSQIKVNFVDSALDGIPVRCIKKLPNE